MAADLTDFDRLVTLCECAHYNHLRAMTLHEEGKASEHFVSACESAHRMARENLRDYVQRTRGVMGTLPPDTMDTSGQCAAEGCVCPHVSKCNANNGCIAAGVKVPRLLTGKEAAALSVANAEEHGDNPFSEWKLIQAVQRKFCAVNGLPEPGRNAGVTVPATPQPKLTVWYGSMPESNGRTNWTAILHKGDMSEGHTIDRSQYPGRVRYAADRVRWLLGELDKEPWILDYDGDERTPCHLCGGSGEKDGKPCWGLNFEGTVHDAAAGVSVVDHQTISEQTPAKGNPTS